MDNQELERIKAVKRFDNFDFALNNAIQGILSIVADIYQTPAAFVTLLGEQEQWFKVNHGFEVFSMPRQTSFCTYTILKREPMVVPDATADERFADNPLVVNVPNIRFYAGAALTDSGGNNIGTICVMDARPHDVPEDKKQYLTLLARQTIYLMELELNYKNISTQLQDARLQNSAFKDISFLQCYEFRTPLEKISALTSGLKGQNPATDTTLASIDSLLADLNGKIDTLEQSVEAAKSSVAVT